MRLGADRSSAASAWRVSAKDIALAASIAAATLVAIAVVWAAPAPAAAAAPGAALGTRLGAPITRTEPPAKVGCLTALSAGNERPRLFVRMRAEAGPGDAEERFASLGFRVVQHFRPLGIWVVEYVGPASAAEAEQTLRDAPGIGWVESAGVRTLDIVPDDPYYFPGVASPGQYGPRVVGLEQAWDVTTGSSQVIAAVLDTGIGRGIPDFAGRIVSPYSAKYDSTLPDDWEDVEGHGSGTAGVAAARGDNGVGVAGAAWGVSIMPVHLSDTASSNLEDEIEGLLWAVEHGADVINLSLGSSQPDLAELDAIRYAIDSGVTVVASAGNSGPGVGIQYPAGYPGVISVGATDRWNGVADFSNSGPGLDLVAPGSDIVTWAADDREYFIVLTGGTSFAAPMVTGIVALMLSEAPDLTSPQVGAMLRETATDLGPAGRDESYGSGLVDADAA
ncbi:MAG: S8 family serine peptidase, partial [Thermoleophilia bacterium]|nr:S8 family serine peptidase [Thermoleophilia bacterium]